ncbi:hypothetical protein NQ318_000939 [Aromia moschata]|uniref:Uncharacterized protein n=1 Tax=Aromia moschata TaxID=1265417 RepID=A0AAV8ZGJ7_9CUCU|nr:hypothetical protein NQ318_000939 [Aromia moschata]
MLSKGPPGDHPLPVDHEAHGGVCVTGQCERDLIVDNATLKVGGVCDAVDRNCESSQIISNALSFSYMWELLVKPAGDAPTIKAEFSLRYKLDEKRQ